MTSHGLSLEGGRRVYRASTGRLEDTQVSRPHTVWRSLEIKCTYTQKHTLSHLCESCDGSTLTSFKVSPAGVFLPELSKSLTSDLWLLPLFDLLTLFFWNTNLHITIQEIRLTPSGSLSH